MNKRNSHTKKLAVQIDYRIKRQKPNTKRIGHIDAQNNYTEKFLYELSEIIQLIFSNNSQLKQNCDAAWRQHFLNADSRLYLTRYYIGDIFLKLFFIAGSTNKPFLFEEDKIYYNNLFRIFTGLPIIANEIDSQKKLKISSYALEEKIDWLYNEIDFCTNLHYGSLIHSRDVVLSSNFFIYDFKPRKSHHDTNRISYDIDGLHLQFLHADLRTALTKNSARVKLIIKKGQEAVKKIISRTAVYKSTLFSYVKDSNYLSLGNVLVDSYEYAVFVVFKDETIVIEDFFALFINFYCVKEKHSTEYMKLFKKCTVKKNEAGDIYLIEGNANYMIFDFLADLRTKYFFVIEQFGTKDVFRSHDYNEMLNNFFKAWPHELLQYSNFDIAIDIVSKKENTILYPKTALKELYTEKGSYYDDLLNPTMPCLSRKTNKIVNGKYEIENYIYNKINCYNSLITNLLTPEQRTIFDNPALTQILNGYTNNNERMFVGNSFYVEILNSLDLINYEMCSYRLEVNTNCNKVYEGIDFLLQLYHTTEFYEHALESVKHDILHTLNVYKDFTRTNEFPLEKLYQNLIATCWFVNVYLRGNKNMIVDCFTSNYATKNEDLAKIEKIDIEYLKTITKTKNLCVDLSEFVNKAFSKFSKNAINVMQQCENVCQFTKSENTWAEKWFDKFMLEMMKYGEFSEEKILTTLSTEQYICDLLNKNWGVHQKSVSALELHYFTENNIDVKTALTSCIMKKIGKLVPLPCAMTNRIMHNKTRKYMVKIVEKENLLPDIIGAIRRLQDFIENNKRDDLSLQLNRNLLKMSLLEKWREGAKKPIVEVFNDLRTMTIGLSHYNKVKDFLRHLKYEDRLHAVKIEECPSFYNFAAVFSYYKDALKEDTLWTYEIVSEMYLYWLYCCGFELVKKSRNDLEIICGTKFQ